MKQFLEEYGKTIFVLVLMAILIAFASPLGIMIKEYITNKVSQTEEIADDEQYLQAYGRPKEPKTVTDKVYCILYDDGELTISQNEIEPDSGRTVLNKGYYQRPKDIDTTDGKQYIRKVKFTEAVKPKNCSYWFGIWNEDNIDNTSCIYLTEIENLNYLYTNECITTRGMFYNCNKLTTLDVSNFDISKITNMCGMFYNCSKLTTLDVNNFDTSNVTNMSFMFYNCNNLTALDVNNFDTSNVTDMKQMFYNCSKLTTLDVSNFNTSNVTNMNQMFYNCSKLTTLDVNNFDTSNVTNMYYMFYNCSNLTVLDVTNLDISNVTDISGIFSHCSKLTTLDVSNFDTSNVTDTSYIFSYCKTLITLDVSNFDTSNVTDMSGMFWHCNNLRTLDVSNFDTSNVTDTSYIFYNLKLITLDLTSFNLSKLETSENMFLYSNISKITSTQDIYNKLYNDTTCAITYVKQWIIQ